MYFAHCVYLEKAHSNYSTNTPSHGVFSTVYDWHVMCTRHDPVKVPVPYGFICQDVHHKNAHNLHTQDDEFVDEEDNDTRRIILEVDLSNGQYTVSRAKLLAEMVWEHFDWE